MKQDEKPLNDGLNPEEFKICVPKKCGLLGDWGTRKGWEEYLKSLTDDQDLRAKYIKGGSECPPTCRTCECEEGWKLCGKMAILHACRVHETIHRQVLGLEHVNAVDVGFVILEKQTRFENFLAIRVHVNQKLAPERLRSTGMSLTDPRSIIPSDPNKIRDCHPPDCDSCHSANWAKLHEWLKQESGQRRGQSRPRRYPIGGVDPRRDLSHFCPFDIKEAEINCEEQTITVGDEEFFLEDIRIAICGVPIDIVNAKYSPSITHPGGDADSGVFVEAPKRSDELEAEERLLIGRGRVNPMVGGISVGSVTGQAGTLGTIAWDRTDATPCVLSNWHVLAGKTTAQVGQPTYQPALFDGGTENDVVAHLKRWHLGEKGDAAIAELAGNRHYASGEILGLWDPISDTVAPELNMEVRKLGRTTGFTEGFVDGIKLAINVDYGGEVVRAFKNQFHISPLYRGEHFSQVGDSGSLVVTRLKPVKLLDDLTQLAKWLQAVRKGNTKICDALEDLKLDPPSKIVEQIRANLKKLISIETPDNHADLKVQNEINVVLAGLAAKLTNKTCNKTFSSDDLLEAMLDQVETFSDKSEDEDVREATRVNYAVGMIFAGDTPGSPFGEFAVASDIGIIADELRISLHPVFEPRSSFRELRVRPDQEAAPARASRSRRGLSPGDQRSDRRGGGPQPEIEPAQSGTEGG